MKKIHNILFLLFASFSASICFSQDDSIRLETETRQGDQRYYDNKYMYLDINFSDDHKLLKLGIQPFKPNENFSMAVFMIHGGFEQKLNSSFSLVNEINAIMLWSGKDAFHQLGYSIGGRYYVGKKKKIAQGLSGDNCNGVYLLVRMSDLLVLNTIKGYLPQVPSGYDLPRLYRGLDYSVMPEIGVGIQQKIKHHLYFDANIACNYDFVYGDFGVGITFLFGGLLSFMN